eukprot:1879020-Rhodomonas_salina.1
MQQVLRQVGTRTWKGSTATSPASSPLVLRNRRHATTNGRCFEPLLGAKGRIWTRQGSSWAERAR